MAVATEVVQLPVQGMTCDHCVGTVRRALEEVAGVQSAAVDLDDADQAVLVEFDKAVARLRQTSFRVSQAVLAEIDQRRLRAGRFASLRRSGRSRGGMGRALSRKRRRRFLRFRRISRGSGSIT